MISAQRIPMKNMSESTKEKRKRVCKFNKNWIQNEEYGMWLRSVDEDDEKAQCLMCSIKFSIKWDGIKALKAHMKTNNHKKNISSFTHTSNLKTFIKSKDSKIDDQVAAAEKRKRVCKFNKNWIQNEEYGMWLRSVDEDDEKAQCLMCNIKFSIKWDGIKALKAHMKTNNHKKNITSFIHTSNLETFIKSKDSKIDDQVAAAEKRKRVCKFNKNWIQNEEYGMWLRSVDEDDEKAQCLMCNIKFSIKWDGIKALKAHMKTNNHKKNITSFTHTSNLETFIKSKDSKIDDQVTAAELTQIYHGVKSHHSFLSMECGNKVNATIFSDSNICKNIKLGRTKIESIVQNVLRPFALELTLAAVTRSNTELTHLPFSIATDVSNKGYKKLFPIAIRYFNINDEEEPIVHSLIDFTQTWGETAEEIFNIIKSSIEKTGLNIKYMTAFGADNVPVNFGCNSSVFVKLQSINKNLIKANYNCHVLHNTAKFALKTTKFDVETLVLKIYSEFSSSACHTKELKDCFDFLDQSYYETLKHVSVRWVSLYKATERLLKNWPAIKLYFLNQGEDECNPIIWTFICEHKNSVSEEKSLPELIIYFVNSFLHIFQKYLLILEKESTDVTEIHHIFISVRNEILQRKEQSFYGFVANQALKNLPESDKKHLKYEADMIYTRALKYLNKWYDYENPFFISVQKFNLKKTFPTVNDCIEINKYFNINNVQLKWDECFNELCNVKEIIAHLTDEQKGGKCNAQLWAFILNRGNFQNLQKIVEFIFSIPLSNAYIERTFSTMNSLWWDKRNRLLPEKVKAELMICSNVKISCKDFYKYIKKKKTILAAARSSKKYKFKILTK